MHFHLSTILAAAARATSGTDAATYANTQFSCEGVNYPASTTLIHVSSDTGGWAKDFLTPMGGNICTIGPSPSDDPQIADIWMRSSEITRDPGFKYLMLVPCRGSDARGYNCCGDKTRIRVYTSVSGQYTHLSCNA